MPEGTIQPTPATVQAPPAQAPAQATPAPAIPAQGAPAMPMGQQAAVAAQQGAFTYQAPSFADIARALGTAPAGTAPAQTFQAPPLAPLPSPVQAPPAPTPPEPQEPAGDDGGDYWKRQARKWEDRAKENKESLSAATRQIAVMQASQAFGVSAEILARMAGTTDEEIAANAQLLRQQAQASAPAAAPAPVSVPTPAQPTAPAFVPAQTQPINPYPSIPDFGATGSFGTSKEDIEAIKDPVKRVEAIRANIGLYK